MNEWEMTEDDMNDVWDTEVSYHLSIAQAAQRKLVEWMYELCNDKAHIYTRLRIECPFCMPELRKGVGVDID